MDSVSFLAGSNQAERQWLLRTCHLPLRQNGARHPGHPVKAIAACYLNSLQGRVRLWPGHAYLAGPRLLVCGFRGWKWGRPKTRYSRNLFYSPSRAQREGKARARSQPTGEGSGVVPPKDGVSFEVRINRQPSVRRDCRPPARTVTGPFRSLIKGQGTNPGPSRVAAVRKFTCSVHAVSSLPRPAEKRKTLTHAQETLGMAGRQGWDRASSCFRTPAV